MYTTEQVFDILNGRWLQKSTTVTIEYLLPDSRTVLFPDRSLFFALQGPRRDGHSFIQEAYSKGIRNFIVSNPPAGNLPGANIILVTDTLQALQQLAAWHRRQFSFPVIGITGSNGKTIVKEWLFQLLQNKFVIVRSPKSYNSQIGVPLSVWQMNKGYTLGLFEAGISRLSEMERLEAVIRPDIGILTNIGEAHSDGFANLQQKANEKLQLFIHASVLIYCSDYKEINIAVAGCLQLPGRLVPIQLLSWGSGSNAIFRINDLQKHHASTSITATYKGSITSFSVPFTDDASLENVMTCYCTLLYLGMTHDFIQEQLQLLVPVAMRLELKKGINNCSIINDSYSADLSSLRIALDFLARQPQHAKKTVILSDILQSGKSNQALYASVAATLQEKQVNRFVGIGSEMVQHKGVFEATGMETAFYESTTSFKNDFHYLKFQNESILLKGARVFAFEQILSLLEQKVHQTVLEINLGNLVHNLQQYQRILAPATKVMAMVKASSYGSGSYEIASVLQFHKADYLAVAYADEGIELRNGGIHLPIMVMNPEPNSFDVLVQFNLEPDIYSFDMFRLFEAYLNKEGIQQFPVHIELETGMNRLGFDTADIHQLAGLLAAGRYKVQSVFTHLAASEDAASDNFTLLQADKYFAAVQVLQEQIRYPFIRHIANSAAIIRLPQLQLDMMRLGIGLYGIDSAATHSLDLKEVSTLRTTVAQVKYLKETDTVGYGRRGVAGLHTVIATIRLGYADGYPRRLGNGKGKMLVNGVLVPVIGTISMDMIMLDVTTAGKVAEGDEVIVFGKELSVLHVADWADTIPYEIMAGISQRVKRVYFEE